MTFNYRMLRTIEGEDYIFNIHEVYYDDENEPKSWSENPVYPQGESPIECLEDLCLMQQAFFKDIMEVNSDAKGKAKLVEINVNRVTGNNK